jgi:hypothetical protein
VAKFRAYAAEGTILFRDDEAMCLADGPENGMANRAA